MGLDIHAASHLRYVQPIPEGDELDRLEEEANKQAKFLSDLYFVLYPNDVYFEEHLADMEPGVYEYTTASEQHEFRAGSYSYYNNWREQLCQFALGVEPQNVWETPKRFAGRPFVELICFTDCDGRIGTRLAAKLAADFRTFADNAEVFAATRDNGERFIEIYRDFSRAFELAAQEGALTFC